MFSPEEATNKVLTFITQHQCDGEQPILTSRTAPDRGVRHLEPVNEHQSQQNHILSDLRGREDGGNPFSERLGGERIFAQRWQGLVYRDRNYFLSDFEYFGGLEPEQAGKLNSKFSCRSFLEGLIV